MAPILPPTPRGYKRTDLSLHDISGEKTISVLTCEKCGSLVVFSKTHDDWHKKMTTLFERISKAFEKIDKTVGLLVKALK